MAEYRQTFSERYKELHRAWDSIKDRLDASTITEAWRFAVSGGIDRCIPSEPAMGAFSLTVDLTPIGIGFLMAIRAENGNGQIMRFIQENSPSRRQSEQPTALLA